MFSSLNFENTSGCPWSLNAGDRISIDIDREISLHARIKCEDGLDELQSIIYSEIRENGQVPAAQYIQEQTVLSILNLDVGAINARLLQRFPGHK